jgi:hypothetical protein
MQGPHPHLLPATHNKAVPPNANVVIKPGGVRGYQGQTLRVIVKLKGQTLTHVAATIKITGSDQ